MIRNAPELGTTWAQTGGCVYLSRRTWYLRQTVSGRPVVQSLKVRSREETELRRRKLVPPSPTIPYVFVNAHPTGSQRLQRGGEALIGRTIFSLVRRLVSPIIGRPVHPHMLRHSFASRLRENGADLQIIQEALGHANINSTTMYANLSTAKRRQISRGYWSRCHGE